MEYNHITNSYDFALSEIGFPPKSSGSASLFTSKMCVLLFP